MKFLDFAPGLLGNIEKRIFAYEQIANYCEIDITPNCLAFAAINEPWLNELPMAAQYRIELLKRICCWCCGQGSTNIGYIIFFPKEGVDPRLTWGSSEEITTLKQFLAVTGLLGANPNA